MAKDSSIALPATISHQLSIKEKMAHAVGQAVMVPSHPALSDIVTSANEEEKALHVLPPVGEDILLDQRLPEHRINVQCAFASFVASGHIAFKGNASLDCNAHTTFITSTEAVKLSGLHSKALALKIEAPKVYFHNIHIESVQDLQIQSDIIYITASRIQLENADIKAVDEIQLIGSDITIMGSAKLTTANIYNGGALNFGDSYTMTSSIDGVPHHPTILWNDLIANS